ncbi:MULTISPECIES: preprotein translocase subunit SecE [Alteribacter]|uniref:Protein translocase subunit SecE n=1 Tax=Alteribacter keqinensis TaxID=2483800 RepID=A0A3M7TMH0_9BACI|nr:MULTISPECIES: preprotein translocase subunit SecE [Alteribacter]MBM7096601.1 preprotein translocase subunit SecE [Alteribacter salitolerans]RNA66153.1 preprotein translocase subunit SecE [Alteribacter keqinensis]
MAETTTSTAKKPVKFLKEVSTEMKRVTWPTRKELVRYTGVVIATVAFIAVFFAIVDLGISELIRLILN